MTLFIILGVVFLGVALMVILGEKFGKPLEQKDQQKYSRIITILVFVALFGALIKALL